MQFLNFIFHIILHHANKQILQGEAIIRPSSKSATHLTVTWKVADGVYQHIDVKEEGKQHSFDLGKTLIINGEV